jgi:hypothetical protein
MQTATQEIRIVELEDRFCLFATMSDGVERGVAFHASEDRQRAEQYFRERALPVNERRLKAGTLK